MGGLFVSDLDGTLLDRQGQLSDYTRANLGRLLDRGMTFSVASARSVHSIEPLLSGLGLTLPVVEFNGGFVTELPSRRAIHCHALDPAVAEFAIRAGLSAGIPPFVSSYVAPDQHLHPPTVLANPGMENYLRGRADAADRRLRAPCDPLSLLDRPIMCVTLIGEHSAVTPLATAVEAAHGALGNVLQYENQYDPGFHWVTVQSASATKARGLAVLAELAGVSLAETTVFGDEVNDLTMFEAAGRGVAVANAVPALKAIATEVIGPHHEDSVVRYLMQRTHPG